MIATCEICKGTGETFHPGQAATAKCWKCEQLGNHVDAVVAYMRAEKQDLDKAFFHTIRLFARSALSYENLVEVAAMAKERLQ